MNLKNYTWNNGTQNSPIILTNDQIKKLIAIGQREDIESNVQGWITTSSRKMHKFFKYALECQFKDLNIICDEELPDSFSIRTSSNVIKEGTKQIINITTDTGINHDFLKWKFDFSDFVIDGDISEQNIKDRIRVENGELVVDDPKENASWSCQLQLTAYPVYYTEADLPNIPATSKPYLILTIEAKKIEDISLLTEAEIHIGSPIAIQVTVIPADSTKLKGARYTYSTTTPDIVSINTSSLGTEVMAKAKGEGNVVVTLHACNNIVTKSNTVNFNVYDMRPVCFVIDQRGLTISDPISIVSKNCIKNTDGTLKPISNNGATGDPNSNMLTWLRQNSHLYVGKFTITNGQMRLKQLDDSTRKKFADGTSSVEYITSESGYYDVWLKFGSDICWKTEPYTPVGLSTPDPDYVLVTMCKEIPAGEDESKWQRWSKNKLIAVYPSTQINNKLYSLSGKRPTNNISYIDSKARARTRGNGFTLVDYQMNCLIALLFYGYYSSLDSQGQCGYGTNNITSHAYHPKITGLTDDLGMTDTDYITGNGASIPDKEQIKAGEGSDIKSVNFWGIENCWGDTSEWIDNLHVMLAKRPNTNIDKNISLYLDDYLSVYPSIIVTELGVSRTITLADMEDISKYRAYVAISDSKGNIVRLIDGFLQNNEGYIKKMQFGDYADVFVKDFGANSSTAFCDYGRVNAAANYVFCRSYYSDEVDGGVGCLYSVVSTNIVYSNVVSRLLFEGTDDNVHIIDDATESL